VKITIVGAGAIGGATGAYLTQSGFDVTLLDNVKEHVEAMNEKGLLVTGCRGDHVFKVKAVMPDALSGPLEMVILAVKGMHTETALAPVAPLLGDDSFVVSMQNGLAEEEIAEVIGRPRTVGCFIQFGSDYLGPGHIQLAYDFPIRVGEIDGRISERVRMVRDVLSNFMPTFVTPNIWGYLWAKMCLGSLYFAGALTAESFGSLLVDCGLRLLFASVARETCTVARALGVKVEAFQGFDPNLFMVDSPDQLGPAYAQWDPKPRPAGVPEEKPLKVHTGIQRDIIVRKRRTEVDTQPGVVVQKGALVGVPTPLNKRIVEMIHEIEDGKRPMGRENLDELHNSAPEWT